MNENIGNVPTGGTAREGEGAGHEEMATETTAGATGDLEFISGMLRGVDVSMTREVRTHGYPTRQQQGRRNGPLSHADGRRGRRKSSGIKNQDVEGPSRDDTSNVSDDSWNKPSSKSNLRFFHCKACDVWIPRGEKVWQTHILGIRHRRQALSIRHTGSRNRIILSAFERDMPKDVLLEDSRKKKIRHSEDDRQLKKSKNIVEHHISFLSRARTSLSAQVLNMFGRDASRMYHSAVACFSNSAFSKVYGHAESLNVTIGSCPGSLLQRVGDFHEFDEEWPETAEPINIYISVCTPAGVVRIADILLQKTSSKKDHNLSENIFLDFGTGASIRPLTTLVDIIQHRKYSLHVKIHRSTRERGDVERNLDSGHAAAYFAALIFFLDEIYSSECNSFEQINNLRRLSFEFPQLALPLGDASFKQGTRHLLRATRRVLEKNAFVENITLKLLERSNTRRQTIDWIDGLRDTINPEIQQLAQKRQESCQIAVLMGWHHRLGRHSPLQLLPRNIVQLIFDLVFKETKMNLLLLV